MTLHKYRVEPKAAKGFSVMLTAQADGEPEGAAVEVAAFVERTEANAKAVELATVDLDRGIGAQVFQAMQ